MNEHGASSNCLLFQEHLGLGEVSWYMSGELELDFACGGCYFAEIFVELSVISYLGYCWNA